MSEENFNNKINMNKIAEKLSLVGNWEKVKRLKMKV